MNKYKNQFQKNSAISPVIAIILIISLTVTMAALSSIMYTSLVSNAANATKAFNLTEIKEKAGLLGPTPVPEIIKIIEINSADNKIILKNTGEPIENCNTKKIRIYINGHEKITTNIMTEKGIGKNDIEYTIQIPPIITDTTWDQNKRGFIRLGETVHLTPGDTRIQIDIINETNAIISTSESLAA